MTLVYRASACVLAVCSALGCSDPATRPTTDTATSDLPTDSAAPADTTDTPSNEVDTPAESDTTETSGPETSPDASVDLEIDWGNLQYPPDHRGETGTTLVVYGRVFESGLTEGSGAGEGLEAELGIGAEGSANDSWTWGMATYSLDVDDAVNDEFVSVLELPPPGTYRYAFRYRKTTAQGPGPWLLADLDGTDNGFDLERAGRLEVIDPRPEVVDWCRLQAPEAIATAPGTPSGTVYGRIYEAGLTENDPGVSLGLIAELGVGTAEDPTTWDWAPASFARRVGNDYEFEGAFETPRWEGEAHYAYRVRLEGGTEWTYCDLSGSDDGFALTDAGVLKIEIPPVDVIDYAFFRPTELRWNPNLPAIEIEVVVFEAGRTSGAGEAPGLSVEVGFGAGASNLIWVPADYRRDEDGLSSLDNDVYVASLPMLQTGTYDLLARVVLDGGDPVFVDKTGTSDGFLPDDAGTLLVEDAPTLISSCRVEGPTPLALAPEVLIGPLRVSLVGMDGMNFDSSAVVAEVGFGRAGTSPLGGTWQFDTALMSEGRIGPEWGFIGNMLAPREEGLWDIAGRVRLSNSDPSAPEAWLYCDRDGSLNGYASEQALRVVIEIPRVDYCRIQFPLEPITLKAGESTPLLFGVVYEPGVTGDGGSRNPEVLSEVGYGLVGEDTEAWSWSPGVFNLFADNGFGQWSNDEYRGTLTPATAGFYAWAWRFSMDGGQHWKVCDKAGRAVFDPLDAGVLIVE